MSDTISQGADGTPQRPRAGVSSSAVLIAGAIVTVGVAIIIAIVVTAQHSSHVVHECTRWAADAHDAAAEIQSAEERKYPIQVKNHDENIRYWEHAFRQRGWYPADPSQVGPDALAENLDSSVTRKVPRPPECS